MMLELVLGRTWVIVMDHASKSLIRWALNVRCSLMAAYARHRLDQFAVL